MISKRDEEYLRFRIERIRIREALEEQTNLLNQIADEVEKQERRRELISFMAHTFAQQIVYTLLHLFYIGYIFVAIGSYAAYRHQIWCHYVYG